MHKIFFILTLSFLLTGCFYQPEVEVDKTGETSPTNQVQTAVNTNTTPPVQKFYPDTSTVKKPTTPAKSAEDSFVVTQELEVKFYLVDKYQPGICYGAPAPVSDATVNNMVNNNAGLSNLIKGRYGYSDNLDIYNKIKQLNGIRLTELAGGKYLFNMTDGQCCSLKAIEGEVTMIGRTTSDEVIRQETQNKC